MDWTKSDILTVLNYLLPGLVTSWVFLGLTAHPRREPFERIVQALIYTALVQTIAEIVRILAVLLGTRLDVSLWDERARLPIALIVAIFLGVLLAQVANKDGLHKRFRKWDWTVQSSRPSQWWSVLYSAAQNEQFVVLHLANGRRLYGWAEEWPDRPDEGHFVMAEAQWISDDGTLSPSNTGVWQVVIPAREVEMIEVMYPASAARD